MSPVEINGIGLPNNLVFAVATKSPNEAINRDEAERAAQTQAAAAALALTPASASAAGALPCQFFFTASSPDRPPSVPGSTRASRHGGAPADVTSIYQANDAGGVRPIQTLSPGIGVSGLFYIASVQQVVCLGDDNSLVTLAEDGDTWQVANLRCFIVCESLLGGAWSTCFPRC